jgi:hypothetical protein
MNSFIKLTRKYTEAELDLEILTLEAPPENFDMVVMQASSTSTFLPRA